MHSDKTCWALIVFTSAIQSLLSCRWRIIIPSSSQHRTKRRTTNKCQTFSLSPTHWCWENFLIVIWTFIQVLALAVKLTRKDSIPFRYGQFKILSFVRYSDDFGDFSLGVLWDDIHITCGHIMLTMESGRSSLNNLKLDKESLGSFFYLISLYYPLLKKYSLKTRSSIRI